MKKRAFAMAIPLLLVLTVTAQAVESRSTRAEPHLDFDGTTASCSGTVKADNARDQVDATLTLYQGRSYVDSWSDSGTGILYISGSCDVESGKSYKLVLDYSINGTAKTPKTTTGTCP